MIKVPYTLKGGNYYPLLRFEIREKGKALHTDALVDSGASISVFQGSIAEFFGLDIESGEEIELQGASGAFTAFLHEVDLWFEGQRYRWKIAFSNELTTTMNVLGRADFFRFFRVTFEEVNKQFFIELIKSEK